MSRNKGSRIEREIVAKHHEANIQAERVPLSGAAGGSFSGDVEVTVAGRLYRAEVKARAGGTGFKTLEGWLGDNDLLFLRRNNAQPIVTMTWDSYIELIQRVSDPPLEKAGSISEKPLEFSG
jgi:Holliday junction resolvase